jgi:hypothetical protein
MKTTPCITIETANLAYEGEEQQRRQREDIARARYGCFWCGSDDGMQWIHRKTLAAMESRTRQLLTLYALGGDTQYLYYPCPECRRAPPVPAEFTLLTMEGGVNE